MMSSPGFPSGQALCAYVRVFSLSTTTSQNRLTVCTACPASLPTHFRHLLACPQTQGQQHAPPTPPSPLPFPSPFALDQLNDPRLSYSFTLLQRGPLPQKPTHLLSTSQFSSSSHSSSARCGSARSTSPLHGKEDNGEGVVRWRVWIVKGERGAWEEGDGSGRLEEDVGRVSSLRTLFWPEATKLMCAAVFVSVPLRFYLVHASWSILQLDRTYFLSCGEPRSAGFLTDSNNHFLPLIHTSLS
jgi:hypothetical protein